MGCFSTPSAPTKLLRLQVLLHSPRMLSLHLGSSARRKGHSAFCHLNVCTDNTLTCQVPGCKGRVSPRRLARALSPTPGSPRVSQVNQSHQRSICRNQLLFNSERAFTATGNKHLTNAHYTHPRYRTWQALTQKEILCTHYSYTIQANAWKYACGITLSGKKRDSKIESTPPIKYTQYPRTPVGNRNRTECSLDPFFRKVT